jgi:hypothetical protein
VLVREPDQLGVERAHAQLAFGVRLVELAEPNGTEAGIEISHRRVQLRHAVSTSTRIGMVDEVRRPASARLGEQVSDADWSDGGGGGVVHCVPTAAVVVDT